MEFSDCATNNNNNNDDGRRKKSLGNYRFVSKKTHESLWHLLHSIPFHSIYTKMSVLFIENTHTSYSFQKKESKSVGSGFVCVFFCAFVFLIAPQNRKNIVIELCVIVCLSNRCLMPIKKIPTSHPAPMTKIAKNKCTNWLRFKRYGDPFKCYCCVEKRHICTHLHTHTHTYTQRDMISKMEEDEKEEIRQKKIK